MWVNKSCVYSKGILELYIELPRKELLRVNSTFPIRARTKSKGGELWVTRGSEFITVVGRFEYH